MREFIDHTDEGNVYEGEGPQEWEWEAYDAQMEYIKEEFGEDAANKANYGWAVDGYTIATKVYGHGVLVTDLALNMNFEEF